MIDTLIKFKRGAKSDIPPNLEMGEPAWTTDTMEMYIGNGKGGFDPICKERLGYASFNVAGTTELQHGEDLELVLDESGGDIVDTIDGGVTYRFAKTGYYLLVFNCCPAVISVTETDAESLIDLYIGSDHWDLGSAYCETVSNAGGIPKGTVSTSLVIAINPSHIGLNISIRNMSNKAVQFRRISRNSSEGRLTVVRLSDN